MIRVNQITLGIEESRDRVKSKVAKALRIPETDIQAMRIFRESLDARKGKMRFVYTVDVAVRGEQKVLRRNKKVRKAPDYTYQMPVPGIEPLTGRPIVVGAGPAGLMAALLLSQAGYAPLLLERGQDVDERTKTVDHFWEKGALNTESNVQFGEGGAGAFSDGKLTTRIKDPRCRKVLETLVEAGAPEEIMFMNKPHVGTDKLKPTVKKIREQIIASGGDVRFNCRVDRLLRHADGSVKGVELHDGSTLLSNAVVLASGHSARDTFEMLVEEKIQVTQKPFAIGVRIEHPQSMIDARQYHMTERPDRLGAAEYHVTHQTASGRGVYTFCMCPGGMVVAASSEEGGVVTNGMSEHARDRENANSAVLVSIQPEDFGDDHPLAGMYLQRRLEKRAYQCGGATYKAPAQLVGDFLKGVPSSGPRSMKPTYTPGVHWTDLNDVLPPYIAESLKEGLLGMGQKLKGFDMEDAVLTAIESRTSSPIRMVRDQVSLESLGCPGLYPCGEGAGYAGGIMSSAVDGLKCAERIIEKYRKGNKNKM